MLEPGSLEGLSLEPGRRGASQHSLQSPTQPGHPASTLVTPHECCPLPHGAAQSKTPTQKERLRHHQTTFLPSFQDKMSLLSRWSTSPPGYAQLTSTV